MIVLESKSEDGSQTYIPTPVSSIDNPTSKPQGTADSSIASDAANIQAGRRPSVSHSVWLEHAVTSGQVYPRARFPSSSGGEEGWEGNCGVDLRAFTDLEDWETAVEDCDWAMPDMAVVVTKGKDYGGSSYVTCNRARLFWGLTCNLYLGAYSCDFQDISEPAELASLKSPGWIPRAFGGPKVHDNGNCSAGASFIEACNHR